jgi:hypothetical protein
MSQGGILLSYLCSGRCDLAAVLFFASVPVNSDEPYSVPEAVPSLQHETRESKSQTAKILSQNASVFTAPLPGVADT